MARSSSPANGRTTARGAGSAAKARLSATRAANTQATPTTPTTRLIGGEDTSGGGRSLHARVRDGQIELSACAGHGLTARDHSRGRTTHAEGLHADAAAA